MAKKIPENEQLLQLLNTPFAFFGSENANRNREGLFRSYANYMMIRILGMFEYKGLPETLNPMMMEKFMLRYGYCIITDVPKNIRNDGGLFTLPGGLGGELDTNLEPTKANVNSPWLQWYRTDMEIGKDCIVIRNDPLWLGLVPLISRYCSQLADAEITLRLQLVNMRTNVLYHANDDTAKEDAKRYLEKIQEGELGIIGGESFFDGIDFDTKDASPKVGASVKDTLEVMQFLRAHSFIELGLNDNYNMKREAINSTETDANADTLLPLVEQMLLERKRGIERLNKLYGLSASVDFAGAWKRVKEDTKLNQEAKKAQVDALEQSEKTEPEETKQEEQEEVTENVQ